MLKLMSDGHEQKKRLFEAIVWSKDPDAIGERVSIWAVNGEEAQKMLESAYGKEINYTLHNEEDADKLR